MDNGRSPAKSEMVAEERELTTGREERELVEGDVSLESVGRILGVQCGHQAAD